MKSWESPIPHKKISYKCTIFCGGDKGIRRKRPGRFRNSEESELVHVSKRQPAGVHVAKQHHDEIVGIPYSHIKKISYKCTIFFGGDKGIRTPDLRIANATLYQLSHIPTNF